VRVFCCIALLALFSPTNAVLGPYNPVTLTIVDDDGLPLAAFEEPFYTAGETAGAAWITVTLSYPYPLTATVDFATAAGTATPGEDYVAVSGTLSFAPGVTARSFSVPIISDTVPEGNETLLLSLINPVNAVVMPNPTEFIIIDQGVPTVQFSAAAYRVGEMEGFTVVTVTLSHPYTWTVSVAYTTTPGTATPGEDYEAGSGGLFFQPGITQHVGLAIYVNQDLLVEGPETLTLSLFLPTNATIGEPGTAVMTIVDDDVVPAFWIYLPLVWHFVRG
jgi:hypothetical protein